MSESKGRWSVSMRLGREGAGARRRTERRFPSGQGRAHDLGGPVPLGEERVMGEVGQESQFT